MFVYDYFFGFYDYFFGPYIIDSVNLIFVSSQKDGIWATGYMWYSATDSEKMLSHDGHLKRVGS